MELSVKIGAVVDDFLAKARSVTDVLSSFKVSPIEVKADTTQAEDALKGLAGAVPPPVNIPVTTDTTAASESIKTELPKSGEEAGKETGKKFSDGFNDIAKTAFSFASGALLANGVSGAISGITNFVTNAIDGAKKAETLAAQTNAVLKSTGGVANVSAGDVKKLSGDISKLTGTTGGAITAGANFLLTFKDIKNVAGENNDIFNQAVATANDMARALDKSGEASIDLTGASLQLGKALNDPTAGVAALARVGVTFTDQQKEQIETLQKSGDMMGAQKIVLAELKSEFGGSAEAFGNTTVGMAAKAKASVGGIAKQIAELILPVLKYAADIQIAIFGRISAVLKDVIGFVKPVLPVVFILGAAFAAWAAVPVVIGAIGSAMTFLSTQAIALNAVIAANPLLIWIPVILAIGIAIKLAYDKFESFRNVVDKIGEALMAFGSLIFSVLILPFQLWWEVIRSVWSAVSSLFSSGSSDGEGFKKVMVSIGVAIDYVKATIAGLTAGVKEVVKVFGEIVDAVVHLDFSKAADLIKGAGSRIGKAVADGAKESLAKSELDDAVKSMGENTKEAIEIKTKIDAAGSIVGLNDELEKTQSQIATLEVKTNPSKDDLKKLDELKLKAGETSAKIAEIAPTAQTSAKVVTTSTGEVVKVFGFSKDKIAETADAQKKLYDAELIKKQEEFGGGLTKVAAQLTEAKNKAEELRDKANKALASGDKKGATEALAAYEEQRKKITELTTALTDGFKKGGAEGLVTKETIEKIAPAMGLSVEAATKLLEVQVKQTAEADKLAGLAKAAGDEFEATTKKIGEAQATAQKDSAGLKEQIKAANAALRKAETEDEKAKLQTRISDLKKALAEQQDAEKKNAIESARLKKVNEESSFDFRTAKQKATKDALEKLLVDESAILDKTSELKAVAAARDASEETKVALEKQQEKERKELAAIDKKREANQKLIADEKIYGGQLSADVLRVNAELEKQKTALVTAGIAERNSIQGKADVKQYQESIKKQEESEKTAIEAIKNRVEVQTTLEKNATDAVGVIETIKATNATKRDLAIISANQEIQLAIDKNAAVMKANEALIAAIETTDKKKIEAAREAYRLAVQNAELSDEGVIASKAKAANTLVDLEKTNANRLEEARISLIADSDRREYESKVLANQKKYDADLEAARGNEARKAEIERTFRREKAEAEEAFNDAQADKSTDMMTRISKAGKDLQKALISGITNAVSPFENTFNAIEKRFMKFADTVNATNEDMAKKSEDAFKKATDEAYKQLKARQISYMEYIKTVDKANAEHGESEVSAGDRVAAAVGQSFVTMGKNAQKNMADRNAETAKSLKDNEKDYKNFGAIGKRFMDDLGNQVTDATVSIASAIGAQAAAGELTMKSAAQAIGGIAFDTVSGLIDTYIPAIIAASISMLGPIAGPIAGALAVAGIKGLLSVARGALGFFEGGFTGDKGVHDVAGVVHGKEYVYPHQTVIGQVPEHEEMNRILKSGVRVGDILGAFKREQMGSGSVITVAGNIASASVAHPAFVATNNDLIVRELRTQTAQLQSEIISLRGEVVKSRTHARKTESTVNIPPVKIAAKGGDLHGVMVAQQKKGLQYS